MKNQWEPRRTVKKSICGCCVVEEVQRDNHGNIIDTRYAVYDSTGTFVKDYRSEAEALAKLQSIQKHDPDDKPPPPTPAPKPRFRP